jgi:hypothetical protein
MSSFGHQTACELLGLTGNGAGAGYRDLLLAELAPRLGETSPGDRPGDGARRRRARRPRCAHLAIRREQVLGQLRRPAAARYLAWLAAHTDYALSDIEAGVAVLAASPGEPAEDAGPSAGQPGGDGDPAGGPGEREPERDGGAERGQAPPDAS